MKFRTFMLLSCFFVGMSVSAQFEVGPVQVIDNSATAKGITHIAKADLNNDNLIDLIVTEAYDSDSVVIYWNNGDGSFTSEVLDEGINDPVYVTTADISGNDFQDILVITETEGKLIWYENSEGTFSNALNIDTEATFGKGIVTGKFDEDNKIDIVAIWQHSINFYHNGGSGNFTSIPILTTENSPNILECWTLTKADVNQDGNLDVVTGETIGAVWYENDGSANFTPHTLTESEQTTITALTGMDINQDTFVDFAMQDATGNVSLYVNEGNASAMYNFEGNLFQAVVNSIEELTVTKANTDEKPDIYTAYQGTPYVHVNEGEMNFSEGIPLIEDESLFINHVLSADIDNDGKDEFIWSSPANMLAYQKNETFSITNNLVSTIEVYPNPSHGMLHIKNQEEVKYVLYNSSGKKLKSGSGKQFFQLDISNLQNGIYYLKLTNTQGKTLVKKIVLK